MNDFSTHPYDRLTPDVILDAIESLGLRLDGRLLALNSYENRVYQIGVEDEAPVVAKFYRPERWSDAAILEEHGFTLELAAHEIPVAAPLCFDRDSTLHRHQGFRFAVYARLGGRMAEFDGEQNLTWMGRYLGRMHAVGATRAYVSRPRLDIASFGESSRDDLRAGAWLPGSLRAAWDSTIDAALELARACFRRAGPVEYLRLHGDCHAGNVLWNDAGPLFVDFDDSRMGPAVQDLWMLLSGDRDGMRLQLEHVLAGYRLFRPFDRRELHLIEALRTLRLIHHSAWLARRWDDPAFPAAFPWFGSERYWQERILELREQIALMQEEPPWPR
jgi:Ser/Thr protein kinase RdoA (MazF antagonist)